MTTKIAVSLPDELVESARTAVEEGRAASVSGYVADAIRAYEAHYSLTDLLETWDAELGPPGPEADAWARAQLGLVDSD